MSNVNPYQSPARPEEPITAALVHAGNRATATAITGPWRSANTLIMQRRDVLPPRCVKCNQPTESRLRRKLSWHPVWVYLLAIPGILIYVIA